MTKISPMTQVDQARGLARARQKLGPEKPDESEIPVTDEMIAAVRACGEDAAISTICRRYRAMRAKEPGGYDQERWPKVESDFTGVLTFSYVDGKPMKAMVTKVTVAG